MKVKWTCSRLFVIGSLGVLRDFLGTSPVALVVENLPASVGEVRDVGSILGSGRSPGGGHGNPLQYSRLENPRLELGFPPGTEEPGRLRARRVTQSDRTEVTRHACNGGPRPLTGI